MRGPFALVLWDGDAPRGLLAQDQLGGRSLFTFHDGPRLCFATEISVLLRLLRRRPDPDELALAHHLVDHSVPDGRMLFHGIRRLGGGCLLELSDAGRAERGLDAALPAAAAGAARRARRAAARRARGGGAATRCRPSGVSALLLSGGLDSSVVAALAAPRAPGLQAIAAAFAEPELDETAWARRVADGTGLGAHHGARSSSASRWRPPRPTCAAGRCRCRCPGIIIEAPLIAAAAELGADVVLDGQGGDELFGAAHFLDRRPPATPATALGMAPGPTASVAGRRPAAASRLARVHERRRPRRAAARPA